MRDIKKALKTITVLVLAAAMLAGAGVQQVFAAENEYSYDDRYAGFLGQGLKHDARFKDRQKIYGIDVSSHQHRINWKQVADAGTEFVFVRVGYRGYVSGQPTEDEYAAYNIREALNHGLKVGVYFFSQAITVEEGIEEADWVSDFLEQNGFGPACIELPVVYDVEYPYEDGAPVGRLYEANLDVKTKTKIALAFLERTRELGYEACFYGSRSAFNSQSKVYMSSVNGVYPIWLAAYTQSRTAGYSGPYDFWQYSSFGKVPGIDTQTDLDVWYYNGKKESTGWIRSAEGTSYVDPESGKALIGWQTILGRSYCFDEKGRMITGWQLVDGKPYHFGLGGIKQIGDHTIGGMLCRFSRSGALESYRHRIDGVWHSYSRVGETVVANMRYAVLK